MSTTSIAHDTATMTPTASISVAAPLEEEVAQAFPPVDIDPHLLAAWEAWQTVPSYVEQQIARYRGLLESIATQR